MTDLLTRLKEATAASRELDAEIWLATTPGATRKTTLVKSTTDKWPPYTIDETRDATGQMVTVPAFTESIDACVALAERKLPGWACGFDCGSKTIIAFVDRHDFSERLFGAKYTAEAKTAPLAILQSLFLALQETDQ